MIKIRLSNEIQRAIIEIEKLKMTSESTVLPHIVENRLRKISMKKSSYASNKLEGNPLTEAQAETAMSADPHRHMLSAEREMLNYYNALLFLDEAVEKKTPFSVELILKVQEMVEKGAPKEKIGLRGAMPPGVLFAVYDSITGEPSYIPPEYSEISELLEELVNYVNTTDDHPLIIAGVVHYQLVTIHPFEDGNGRTARLISGYVLDLFGYGFRGIGSLEEYFQYNQDEYYESLQMGLPAFYYSGRNNPPHPEIWIMYFLRMFKLYAKKVAALTEETTGQQLQESLSHLSQRERNFLNFILSRNVYVIRPNDVAKLSGLSRRTVQNRCIKLVQQGYLAPEAYKQRIQAYHLTEFAKENKEQLINMTLESC